MHPKDPIRGRLIEGYVNSLWREAASLRTRRRLHERRHPASATIHIQMQAGWLLAALTALLVIVALRGGG